VKREAAAFSVRAQRCQSHYFSTTPRMATELFIKGGVLQAHSGRFNSVPAVILEHLLHIVLCALFYTAIPIQIFIIWCYFDNIYLGKYYSYFCLWSHWFDYSQ